MLRLCCTLLLLVTLVSAEVINYHVCPDALENCSIDQVRVDPCPQAAQRAACHVRRRRPSKISFDFTPNFDADTLETTLGWAKSDTEELPLLTMERDACKSTSCPAKKGVQQTYSVDVPIEAKFPLSPYTIRWALKDPVSGKRCCFTMDIKVVR